MNYEFCTETELDEHDGFNRRFESLRRDYLAINPDNE